ncbi:MAG: aminoacyl--tRNA ligase-related protein [Patescibacteria group bacterium]
MKLSNSSFKPLKNPPANADTVNHKLLVQAGYVRQLMAGVYTFLPLGLRTLNKIRDIIREEMDDLGGQEVRMPALIPANNLKKSGSWENVDILFKLNSQTGKNYGLGFSHEEVITPLAKEAIKSYKDLPAAIYQIQWKFRDELRAKSGILRGREFEMKDMYSFHENQKDFENFYEKVKKAYLKAYERIGLTAKVTEASGGNFTEKVSYEFMVLTNAGEDDILYCSNCEFCVNTEIAKVKEEDNCPKCKAEKLKKARASEVGNVFDLGQKYVKDFDLKYMDKDGSQKYPIMGCYGWGTTRTMGVLVEKFADEKGIAWPESVAPFQVQLIGLRGAEEKAKAIYKSLKNNNIEVLWDDRDESPGSKFAAADLIGCPIRLVVSEKTGDEIE